MFASLANVDNNLFSPELCLVVHFQDNPLANMTVLTMQLIPCLSMQHVLDYVIYQADLGVER